MDYTWEGPPWVELGTIKLGALTSCLKEMGPCAQEGALKGVHSVFDPGPRYAEHQHHLRSFKNPSVLPAPPRHTGSGLRDESRDVYLLHFSWDSHEKQGPGKPDRRNPKRISHW